MPAKSLIEAENGANRFTRRTWGADIRETVLSAARGVISQQGASHLTMDAVAAKAGISKGGLLYHFPSKDALLQELLREWHENFVRNCKIQFRSDPKPHRPGRIHRAWIHASWEMDVSSSMEWSDIVMVIANAGLASSVRAFWQGWISLLSTDGLPEESSLMVQMALEGCKAWRLIGSETRSILNDGLFAKLLEIATIENKQMDYEAEGDVWERCLLEAWKEM